MNVTRNYRMIDDYQVAAKTDISNIARRWRSQQFEELGEECKN